MARVLIWHVTGQGQARYQLQQAFSRLSRAIGVLMTGEPSQFVIAGHELALFAVLVPALLSMRLPAPHEVTFGSLYACQQLAFDLQTEVSSLFLARHGAVLTYLCSVDSAARRLVETPCRCRRSTSGSPSVAPCQPVSIFHALPLPMPIRHCAHPCPSHRPTVVYAVEVPVLRRVHAGEAAWCVVHSGVLLCIHVDRKPHVARTSVR